MALKHPELLSFCPLSLSSEEKECWRKKVQEMALGVFTPPTTDWSSVLINHLGACSHLADHTRNSVIVEDTLSPQTSMVLMLNRWYLLVFLLPKVPNCVCRRQRRATGNSIGKRLPGASSELTEFTKADCCYLGWDPVLSSNCEGNCSRRVGNRGELNSTILSQIKCEVRVTQGTTRTFKWVSQPRLYIATFTNSIPLKDMSLLIHGAAPYLHPLCLGVNDA